jgi:hypothetical protein
MFFSVVLYAGNELRVISTEVDNSAAVAIIRIDLHNSNDQVAGLQLDIRDIPDQLAVNSVTVTQRSADFNVSWNPLDNGTVRILLYSLDGAVLPDSVGSVLNINYNVSALNNARTEIQLEQVTLTDSIGNALSVDSIASGYIQVGMLAVLSCGAAVADAGDEGVLLQISLANTEPVSGVQLDFIPNPTGVIDVDTIQIADRTEDFMVSYARLSEAFRILLFHPGGNTITPGTGAVINIYLRVDSLAFAQIVKLLLENVIIAVPGGGQAECQVFGNNFIVEHGYLFPPQNLVAVSALEGVVPLTWEAPNTKLEPRDFIEKTDSISNDILSGYRIYRTTLSPCEPIPDNLIDSVGSAELSWNDSTVVNSQTYYYVVTADYGISGESEPTNEVQATPLESVEIYVGSGMIMTGESGEIPIFLTTTSTWIGVIEFVIRAIPDYAYVTEVNKTSRLAADSWVVIGEAQGDSAYKVFVADISGVGVDPGEEAILKIKFQTMDLPEPAIANLVLENIHISDIFEHDLLVTDYPGILKIGVAAQLLQIRYGQAEPGALGQVKIALENTKTVGGFEFRLRDVPDYLSGVSVTRTERLGGTKNSWTVTGHEQSDGSFKVLGFDLSGNGLSPGNGSIITIGFAVNATAPRGAIPLTFENIIIADLSGYALYSQGEDSHFGIGQPDVVYYFEPINARIGSVSRLKILMENAVAVSGFQFTLQDNPNICTPLLVQSTLPTGWDVSFSELPDGALRVLGYNFTGLQIPAETTTHLLVYYQITETAELGLIPLYFTEAIAADPDSQSLWAEGLPGEINLLEAGDPRPNPAQNPLPADSAVNVPYNETQKIELGWEYIPDPDFSLPTRFKILMGDSLDTTASIHEPFIDYQDYELGRTDYYNVTEREIPRGSTWYWQVIPFNTAGEAIGAKVWTFSTEPEQALNSQDDLIPEEFALFQNYPNPFNPFTSIRYTLPVESEVRLDIFNLLGQHILTLVNGDQKAGFYQVIWDTSDAQGQPVRSGIYVYRLIAGNFIQTKKMILMK